MYSVDLNNIFLGGGGIVFVVVFFKALLLAFFFFNTFCGGENLCKDLLFFFDRSFTTHEKYSFNTYITVSLLAKKICSSESLSDPFATALLNPVDLLEDYSCLNCAVHSTEWLSISASPSLKQAECLGNLWGLFNTVQPHYNQPWLFITNLLLSPTSRNWSPSPPQYYWCCKSINSIRVNILWVAVSPGPTGVCYNGVVLYFWNT